jgi:hypothetical protein
LYTPKDPAAAVRGEMMEILVCVRKLILQRKKKKKKGENELFSVYTVWFIDLYTGRLCGIEQRE